jgi:hypothetical protein
MNMVSFLLSGTTGVIAGGASVETAVLASTATGCGLQLQHALQAEAVLQHHQHHSA